MRAPIVGIASIVGAARSAGHGCGRVPEENHFMCRVTDGSQAVTPRLGPAYHLTIEADGNQRADSSMEQLNFRSDVSQSSSSRLEQNRGFYAQFPWY